MCAHEVAPSGDGTGGLVLVKVSRWRKTKRPEELLERTSSSQESRFGGGSTPCGSLPDDRCLAKATKDEEPKPVLELVQLGIVEFAWAAEIRPARSLFAAQSKASMEGNGKSEGSHVRSPD